MIEIVGGGLIGLGCAWELQQRGIDVVVYERDLSRRTSASWAGAGMLGALAETFPDEVWRQRALASAAMYRGWVEALGGSVDFYEGGADADGHVDPRDLLRELSLRVPVKERVVSSLGELEGEQVVVCAGAWGLPGLPAVEPVKGYLLAWDGLPAGSLRGILRDGHTYILQRENGRVIAGSTEERISFDGSMDAQVISGLRERAEEVWPLLKTMPVTDCWFGYRPAAAGAVPVLRRLDERVVLAYGHYRNGILLAPWTARWVADEVQRQLGK
ncbi:MAG: FAD-dependent oxidoreductase [Acidobacteria bacterium]|nr:FAD-dependent oxidoreductase [Acidobacteriota bacterium]